MTDAPWVGQTDASTAGHSADRSAVCSVASMEGTTVGTMDACSAGQRAAKMDASTAVHWVESLAAERDVRTVVVLVASMVATRVVVTDASTVGHSADCSACARGDLMAVHWVDLLVASMAERWVAARVGLTDAT